MNTPWILEHIEALGRLGVNGSGGRTRLCFTPEDEAGLAYVRSLMVDLDLQIREDSVGNLFGRLEGTEPDAPAILVGSHVDTVLSAGAYDGCQGVLTALASIKGYRDRGEIPRIPIEVVSFMGEESSRFGLAMIGSRAFVGALDPAETLRYKDAAGQTLADALMARGTTSDGILQARSQPGRYRAYLELHVDQGEFLDAAGISVGVVTGIAAPARLHFTIHGEAAHSGAASPENRRDALMASARVLSQVEDLARREYPYQTVATIGRLEVFPNAINIVPGRVSFTVDVRGVNTGSRHRLIRQIQRAVAREVTSRGMTVSVQVMQIDEPVLMSSGLQRVLTESATMLGISNMPMPSMAGHDAMQVAKVCPAAMMLCRNISRISHSPLESPADRDVDAAAQVLDRAICRLAAGEEFE